MTLQAHMHMKLIVRLRQESAVIDTAFLMCAVVIDFISYISYVISRQFLMDKSTVDVSVIRTRVWTQLPWTSNFIVDDLPLLELITMQLYVQPRVIRTPAFVRTSIPDYVPHDSEISTTIPSYPFVSIANAARLDIKPMSLVPRHPEETIVARTGKQLRAVLFNGGSPSRDVSRTVHIAYENINQPWKGQRQCKKFYRNRNVTYPPSDPTAVGTSPTGDTTELAYYSPDLIPTKFSYMKTFTASHTVVMATTQYIPAKTISEVGEQWKLTDISRMSSMSIQSAFGDSKSIHSRSP